MRNTKKYQLLYLKYLNHRIDLGIWMLKQCPKGYNFFAPIQRCETIELIAKRQILCDGPNASKFIFCPSNNDKKVNETTSI